MKELRASALVAVATFAVFRYHGRPMLAHGQIDDEEAGCSRRRRLLCIVGAVLAPFVATIAGAALLPHLSGSPATWVGVLVPLFITVGGLPFVLAIPLRGCWRLGSVLISLACVALLLVPLRAMAALVALISAGGI